MTATHPWIELPSPPVRSVRRRPLGLSSLLLGVVLAGLALSTLRVHVTRLRYERAEALQEERALLDEQHRLRVEVQALRQPTRLRTLAHSQGFGTPTRVIDLTEGLHRP